MKIITKDRRIIEFNKEIVFEEELVEFIEDLEWQRNPNKEEIIKGVEELIQKLNISNEEGMFE